MRFAVLALVAIAACAVNGDKPSKPESGWGEREPPSEPHYTDESTSTVRPLYRAASFAERPMPPAARLENAPIVFLGFHRVTDTITAVVLANDSLRVVVTWAEPADTFGVSDSTMFRIRASRTIRFMGGGTVAPETWRRRKHAAGKLADTFKVAMPGVGDSVMFRADSIQQCRRSACSVPGSAAWGYQRSAAPPAMTFIKVTVDSF